jgi:large subunit ribosomal protein L10
MVHPTKEAAVAELSNRFSGAGGAVLTEYRGLTVAQLKQLRRSLAEHATYAVVKNTLTKIAAERAGIDSFTDELLSGPSAVAFITGDPVEAAKGLRAFARLNPALVIKAGVLDGKPITADEINRLADLESREVLLARLAGAMKGSLSQAVGLFAAPLSQAVRLVVALQEKVEAEGPAEAAVVDDAAPEAAATETAAPEAAAPDADSPETVASEAASSEAAPEAAAPEAAEAEAAEAETPAE